MAKQQTRRVPGRYGLDEIAASHLESWPNDFADRDYIVHLEIPEFTCLCPRSGFADFATMVVDYAPDRAIVELKSLKLYINGFRNQAISHEGATNTIRDDLVKLLAPRWLRVMGEFNVRGNIKTVVTVEYTAEGYDGPRPDHHRPTFTGI